MTPSHCFRLDSGPDKTNCTNQETRFYLLLTILCLNNELCTENLKKQTVTAIKNQ